MKDVPKEMVLILLAVYAVLLIVQSYVLLDYGVTGRGTTGIVSLCIGGLPQFVYPLGCADNVTVGKLYYCDLDVTNDNDNITFSDNTSLFQIGSKTGIIAFSPDLTEVGIQNSEITIQNFCQQNSTILSINVTRPVCGNDLVEVGETCDDGNVVSGDGCSSTCKLEIPTATTTTTTVVNNFGGGGGGGGGAQRSVGSAGITVAAPTTLSLSEGSSVTVPVYVTNTETTDMEEVFISATANPLTVKVEPTYIQLIPKGKSQKVLLTVDGDGSNPGEHMIELLVFSKRPKFEKTQKIYVSVNPKTSVQPAKAQKPPTKLELSYQLLAQHPECIIIKEIINEAQEALVQGQFEKSEALAQSAVDICYYFSGITPKEPVPQNPILLKQNMVSNITVPLIIVGLLLVMLSVYLWKTSKNVLEYPSSSTLIRVNSIIQDIYKFIESGNISEAKRSYASLRRIYAKLKKHEQSKVYKDIVILYKEIEEAVRK